MAIPFATEVTFALEPIAIPSAAEFNFALLPMATPLALEVIELFTPNAEA